MTRVVQPPVTTVVLDGEIDVATSPAVRQALMAAISAGTTSLIVDMSAVEFIDATGIGALIAAANHAREAGGGVVLQAPSPQVQRLIGILHLGHRLPALGNLNTSPPLSGSAPWIYPS